MICKKKKFLGFLISPCIPRLSWRTRDFVHSGGSAPPIGGFTYPQNCPNVCTDTEKFCASSFAEVLICPMMHDRPDSHWDLLLPFLSLLRNQWVFQTLTFFCRSLANSEALRLQPVLTNGWSSLRFEHTLRSFKSLSSGLFKGQYGQAIDIKYVFPAVNSADERGQSPTDDPSAVCPGNKGSRVAWRFLSFLF